MVATSLLSQISRPSPKSAIHTNRARSSLPWAVSGQRSTGKKLTGIESGSRRAAAQAAKAMGYDSCPMIGFDPVKVAEIINLPSDHVLGFMIAVGKAVKLALPKGGQLALSEVVVKDLFA